MVTQCTRYDRLVSNREPRKMDMYIQNLVQKFNAKLGGVNQLVSLMRALTSPSGRSDVFMFFGIDCTHVTCSRERPSIAAIIGSKDSTSSLSSTSSSFFFTPRVFSRYSICWSGRPTVLSEGQNRSGNHQRSSCLRRRTAQGVLGLQFSFTEQTCFLSSWC